MIRNKIKVGSPGAEQEIPIFLGWRLAQGKLSELGVNVLNIFTAENNAIQTIMLDDNTMLKVWYFYVNEELGLKYEEALDLLDETPGGLEPFKQAFWELVVGFTNPVARQAAKELWDKAKLQLKKNLKNLSLDSSEESE